MDDVSLRSVNAALDTAVLVESADGGFLLLDEVPDWLIAFNDQVSTTIPFRLEETLVFFDSFLDEIRESLARDPSAKVGTGPWIESDLSGAERNLSAVALQVDNRIVVQLRLIGESQLYHQAVFQKAREYSLNYERLLVEREKKEVLLHTLVHDLAGPLTAITGALSILAEEDRRGKGSTDRELVNIALNQCEVEREMIQSILESYAAEFAPFDPAALSYDAAPDFCAVADDLYLSMKPAFENQGVELTIDRPAETELKVVAERDLLSRVLSNLLQNALRFSPAGSQTRVTVKPLGDHVRVDVTDQGQGIAPDIQEALFDRFQGGRQYGGKIGLGLYFCRITVERWGGRIGHDQTYTKGARLFVELPLKSR